MQPWAGDIFGHPELLIPGVADKYRLQPAYDYIAEVIREVDKQTLIFFAAVTWDDFVPAGFTHAPGGAEYSDGYEYICFSTCLFSIELKIGVFLLFIIMSYLKWKRRYTFINVHTMQGD